MTETEKLEQGRQSLLDEARNLADEIDGRREVEAIYGRPQEEIKAPEGYEFVSKTLLEVGLGDTFLSKSGQAALMNCGGAMTGRLRLLLRPIDLVRRIYGKPWEELVIPEGFEVAEEKPRLPLKGEEYLTLWGTVTKNPFGWEDLRDGRPWERIILRRTPTVESVYGKPLDQLSAPKGWEFTGKFRPPKAGECWLSSQGPYYSAVGPLSRDGNANALRLILRKAPPRRRLVFDIVGKRAPKVGDWFRATTGVVLQAGADYEGSRLILSPGRIEEAPEESAEAA